MISFECDLLDVTTDTNQCYACDQFNKCELVIDKIYEDDEIASDVRYDEKINIHINVSDNKICTIPNRIYEEKDPRWWMN